MTPKAQRIVIAEACGWKRHIEQPHSRFTRPPEHTMSYSVDGLPDYLADLNAMHEAEKQLTPEQRETYAFWLSHVCEIGTYLFATAPERAEAFLRTLNLWDDSK